MSLDIEIKNARVYFPVKSGYVRAVDGISATFKEGEITGIIGESGCGKSVLGMYLLGMLPDYAVKAERSGTMERIWKPFPKRNEEESGAGSWD